MKLGVSVTGERFSCSFIYDLSPDQRQYIAKVRGRVEGELGASVDISIARDLIFIRNPSGLDMVRPFVELGIALVVAYFTTLEGARGAGVDTWRDQLPSSYLVVWVLNGYPEDKFLVEYEALQRNAIPYGLVIDQLSRMEGEDHGA